MKLAVIGAGQLGSRHLQALAHLEGNVSIQVLDLNQASLDIAKQRMEETNFERSRIEVEYIKNSDNLYENIDVVIIATGANVRRKAIEDALAQSKVTYMVLEKVLFQKVDDYHSITDLLSKHSVKAWVNCPQRTWSVYQQIATWLQNNEPIDMSVSGGNWGLACNSIHYIDLFAFLAKRELPNISASSLDRRILSSKRESFIEFSGTLTGSNAYGDRLSLTCFENNAPVVVNISTPSPCVRLVVTLIKSSFIEQRAREE